MRQVVTDLRHRNGDAGHSIGGRGILRRKLSTEERVELATDVALGLVTVTPSITQAAALVGAPLYRVKEEIRRADAEYKAKADAEARAAVQEEAEVVNAQVDVIVAACTSPVVLEAAVRTIGVATVWDAVSAIVT
jgi:hypothetical protein